MSLYTTLVCLHKFKLTTKYHQVIQYVTICILLILYICIYSLGPMAEISKIKSSQSQSQISFRNHVGTFSHALSLTFIPLTTTVPRIFSYLHFAR